jgi:hypothetical protein
MTRLLKVPEAALAGSTLVKKQLGRWSTLGEWTSCGLAVRCGSLKTPSRSSSMTAPSLPTPTTKTDGSRYRTYPTSFRCSRSLGISRRHKGCTQTTQAAATPEVLPEYDVLPDQGRDVED